MSFIKELQSMQTIFALLIPKRLDRFWKARFDAGDYYLYDYTCVHLSNTTYFPKKYDNVNYSFINFEGKVPNFYLSH